MGEMVVQEKSFISALNSILNTSSIKKLLENSLKENAGAFATSLIELCSNDKLMQVCDPKAIVIESLKAATLKLPLNKNLGYAFVIPYKSTAKNTTEPQFQMGYKGYIQLAMRTGQYKFLNADVVYEGEFIKKNKLTGEIDLNGEKISDTVVGYFAYMELLNGFTKIVYSTKEEVLNHAKEYSQAYKSDLKKGWTNSYWSKNFNDMAKKTVLKDLLSHFGILSTEMATAFSNEYIEENEVVTKEITQNANQGDIIDMADIEPGEIPGHDQYVINEESLRQEAIRQEALKEEAELAEEDDF